MVILSPVREARKRKMIVTTNHDEAESLSPEEEFDRMTSSNDWVVRVRILR